MTVCERIDNILKERGMSRRKLAEQAGISPSSLQSALSRNTGLSLDMLMPISDVLGLSAQFLNGIEEQPEPTQEELQVTQLKRYIQELEQENNVLRAKLSYGRKFRYMLTDEICKKCPNLIDILISDRPLSGSSKTYHRHEQFENEISAISKVIRAVLFYEFRSERNTGKRTYTDYLDIRDMTSDQYMLYLSTVESIFLVLNENRGKALLAYNQKLGGAESERDL